QREHANSRPESAAVASWTVPQASQRTEAPRPEAAAARTREPSTPFSTRSRASDVGRPPRTRSRSSATSRSSWAAATSPARWASSPRLAAGRVAAINPSLASFLAQGRVADNGSSRRHDLEAEDRPAPRAREDVLAVERDGQAVRLVEARAELDAI